MRSLAENGPTALLEALVQSTEWDCFATFVTIEEPSPQESKILWANKLRGILAQNKSSVAVEDKGFVKGKGIRIIPLDNISQFRAQTKPSS